MCRVSESITDCVHDNFHDTTMLYLTATAALSAFLGGTAVTDTSRTGAVQMSTVSRNANMGKLQAGYLFPEIGKRRNAFLEANPDAQPIISLGIGDTTLPVPDHILNGLKQGAANLGTKEGYSGYGPEQGIAALRGKISENLYDGKISADEVFVSDGSKCDIGRLQMMFGSGTTTAVQDPSYPVYVDTSVIMGQTGQMDTELKQYDNIVYMPCNPSNNFFPDLKSTPRADVVYFCSPNNPTGAAATKAQLQVIRPWHIERAAAPARLPTSHDRRQLVTRPHPLRLPPRATGARGLGQRQRLHHRLRRGVRALHPLGRCAQVDLRDRGRAHVRDRGQLLLQVRGLHRRSPWLDRRPQGAHLFGRLARRGRLQPHHVYAPRGMPPPDASVAATPPPHRVTRAEASPTRLVRAGTAFNGASNIVQQGALAALDPEGLKEISSLIDYYMENAAMLKQAMLDIGLEVHGGDDAPYVFVDLKVRPRPLAARDLLPRGTLADADPLRTLPRGSLSRASARPRPQGKSSWDMFSKILEEAQVVTIPGAGFGPGGEGFLRLSAFAPRDSCIEACERLRTAMKP